MCVFKMPGDLDMALHSNLSGIMHRDVGMNRRNALKYSNAKKASSNKAFEAAARDLSVFP